MQDDVFFQENNIGHHIATIFDELAGFTYFVKDTELRYVAFNQRLTSLFGVESGTEILGKKDEDFMPEHIVKSIREDDNKILETGKPVLNRIELVPTGNGFVDWSTTTKKPLHDNDGKVCGITGVTRPFSQSTASLRQSDELGTALKLMHESFRDNIAITHLAASAHLSLSSFQRKFKACFGMSPKEYIRHLKVQDACHRIMQSTQNFAEISYACGFSEFINMRVIFKTNKYLPPRYTPSQSNTD